MMAMFRIRSGVIDVVSDMMAGMTAQLTKSQTVWREKNASKMEEKAPVSAHNGSRRGVFLNPLPGITARLFCADLAGGRPKDSCSQMAKARGMIAG